MTMMVTMMMVMMMKMIEMKMKATTMMMMTMMKMMMVVLYDCDAGHDGDYQNGDGCRFLSLQIRSNIPVPPSTATDFLLIRAAGIWETHQTDILGVPVELICNETLYSSVQQGQHPSPSHGLNKSIN